MYMHQVCLVCGSCCNIKYAISELPSLWEYPHSPISYPLKCFLRCL